MQKPVHVANKHLLYLSEPALRKTPTPSRPPVVIEARYIKTHNCAAAAAACSAAAFPAPPFQEFGGKALGAAEQAEAGVSGLFGGGNVARKLGVDNGGLSLLATTTTTTTIAMGTFDVLLLMMMMMLLQLPFTVLLLV